VVDGVRHSRLGMDLVCTDGVGDGREVGALRRRRDMVWTGTVRRARVVMGMGLVTKSQQI